MRGWEIKGKNYYDFAGSIAWVASLLTLVFFYYFGCSSVYPWLKNHAFLLDRDFNVKIVKHFPFLRVVLIAKIARNIIISSYYLFGTAFIVGSMRPAIEDAINLW